LTVDNQLLNPNLHAALLHLPIGLFAVGMLVEIFSFMYSGGGARKAARYMIVLGVLLMIPVSLSGAYALSDVVRRSMPPGQAVDQPWTTLIARTQLHQGQSGNDLQGEQWHMVLSHAWKMSTATVVAVLAVFVGIACSGRWWKRLYIPIGVVLLASLAWIFWGAWSGGEMVYQWRTAVQLDINSTPRPTPMPSAAMEQTERRTRDMASYYAPPLQTHVVVGGLAAAFAIGALGLALRNTSRPESLDTEQDILLSPVAADVAMVRSFKPAAAVTLPPERAPAARTWLAAGIAAVGAAVLGLWFLASATDAVNVSNGQQRPLPAVLWDTVKTPVQDDRTSTSVNAVPQGSAGATTPQPANPLGLNRRLAHIIAGISIVVLPFILAVLAKWAPQRRLPLTITAILLVAALGVQVWLGVLMLFDGPAGHVVNLRQ
jgi:hypothetical protein